MKIKKTAKKLKKIVKKSSNCNIAHYNDPLREANLWAFVESLKIFKSPYIDNILKSIFCL